MQSVPNIRKFLLGASLLGAAVAGQVSLRNGAGASGLLAGAPLLLSAAAFAALLRRPLAQPQPRLAPPMNWRDWEVRVVSALVGTALVLIVIAWVILDVAAPSARFWNVYAAALGLAVAAPIAALVVERRRGGRALSWPWLATLGGIVALAALVRLVFLATLPFGLWYDEAANGLEALRVLNEPQYRPVYTDGVNATGHYLFLVAAALEWFGANATSIRLVSVLMGVATVAATYLAGRELYSESVALAAAALMAVSRWAINFSRLGMYNIATPLFELLTVAFLLRALRRNRAADFALAGLSLGLGLCFYPAFQLFAAAVGLFLALGVASRRLSLSRMAFGLALMVACAFIVIAPVAKFATEKPDLYFSRVQGTSLFSDKTSGERAPALGANLRKHLLMFNVRGDPNGRHNLPGEPMLDPITAALFVAGIALSVARRRQPVYLLLPAWLLVALLGGILSLDFEAPQSLRSIGALPPAMLLAAFPLNVLEQEWASGGGKWTPHAFGAMLFVLLIPVTFVNLDIYFRRQARDFAAWNAHSTPETLAAERLNSLDPNTRAYIISLFDQHPTVRFLTHNQATTRLDTTATLPLVQAADAGMALILDAERKFLYDEARRLYPNAQHEEVQAPFGSPVVLYYVKITPEEVAALQGLEARYFAGGELTGRPAVVRKEGRLDLAWPQEAPLPLPFVAEWQGVLVAESYGPYQFGLSAPGRAELYVDERLALAIQEDGPRDASESLILPRGHHSLRVTAQGTEGTMRLLWRTPDGAPSVPLDEGAEALPAADVFVSPVSNHGLLGRYFPNGEWSGSEALAQIDTRLEMYFHIVPLSRPYTVEWTGKIAIPEAGDYGFGLASVDESSLEVDGREVASSAGKGDYGTGNVKLAEGLHDVRIRYADRTNHTGISVYWTPPGSAGRQIIPSSALYPPQGDYSRVELPSFDDLWGEAEPAPGNAAVGVRMPADMTVMASGLAHPAGLAILKDGRVAVAVPDEPAVWVIDTANNTREALTRDGEYFVEPFDVALDSHGKLYVLDAGAGQVSLFDSDLAYMGDLAIDERHAVRARGIHVDDADVVWLADTSGGEAAAFAADGSLMRTLAVRRDLSAAGEAQPVDVLVMPDGAVWVTDSGVHKLTLYSPAGLRLRSWDIPVSNTVDGSHLAAASDGAVYMTEPESRTIVRMDGDGTDARTYAIGEVDGSAVKPVGVAVDSMGNVWVTDVEGGRVLRVRLDSGDTNGK